MISRNACDSTSAPLIGVESSIDGHLLGISTDPVQIIEPKRLFHYHLLYWLSSLTFIDNHVFIKY